MDKLLTAKQVGEILGISRAAARTRMISIPGVIDLSEGVNRQLRVTEKDLQAYIANQTLRPRTVTRIQRRSRKEGSG